MNYKQSKQILKNSILITKIFLLTFSLVFFSGNCAFLQLLEDVEDEEEEEEDPNNPNDPNNPTSPTGTNRLPVIPIKDAESQKNQWVWLTSEHLRCRDNSATGIGVRLSSDTDQKNLLIYLRPGGACFNAPSCALAAYKYEDTDFQEDITVNLQGIFDETNTDNPFADWHKVFVPYCTGDVHTGNLARSSGFLPQLTTTLRDDAVDVKYYTSGLFRGYKNMEVVARSAASYFKAKGIEKVVLTGSSAGGFGTYINYDLVAKAFGTIPLTGIVDGAPLFDDNTIGPDCGAATVEMLWQIKFPSDYNNYVQTGDYSQHKIFAIYKYLGEKYADRQFGLLSHTEDQVIRAFFGAMGFTGRVVDRLKDSSPHLVAILGSIDCITENDSAGADVPSASPMAYTDFGIRDTTYSAGLTTLQNSFTAANNRGNWRIYLDSDDPTEHTFFSDNTKFYDTTSSDGTHIYTWINTLIEGTAGNKTD